MEALSDPPPTAVVPGIEWAVAGRALPGETESGDGYVVRALPGSPRGGALLAVIDGLGHGPGAAAVTRAAVATLQAHAEEAPTALLLRCHEALRGTRGAVMTLARVEADTLTWVGVGNVEAVLLRADPAASPPHEAALLRGGVVGYQLPALQARTLPLAPGDLLVLVTDGIRSAYVTDLPPALPPRELAEHVLAGHARERDDALVLIARYAGDPP